MYPPDGGYVPPKRSLNLRLIYTGSRTLSAAAFWARMSAPISPLTLSTY